MIVLGIDPGSRVTGYGIIKVCQSEVYGCLDFGGIQLKSVKHFHDRLKKIYDKVTKLIQTYEPDVVAFEDIFFSQNVKAAMKLGQARGAAIIASLNADKPVEIYSPREVKQSITGYGASSKEQVQKMVSSILNIEGPISPLDASDALAIAICHANRNKYKKIFLS